MEKIEITDEMLDFVASGKCGECLCEGCICQKLCASTPIQLKEIFARALKSERAERAKNPGVWDGAPEWASDAWIQWRDRTGKSFNDISHAKWKETPYRRDLPKTKARVIAERKALIFTCGQKEMADIIESAILEALADKK